MINTIIFNVTKYDSRIIAKFVNSMMYDGKKSISEAIMYSSFDMLSERIEVGDKINAFHQALENVKP
uniref:Small ribosomal subunit protein uS7 domain-containing protein n=1 Tax=Borrelia miyamotoi TaxID=47466 RepID=A0A482CXY0_9SPIR|nr:hypothetical protein EZU71_06735 [Borrelia miyamotoi]